MPPITVLVADHKKSGRAACLRLLQPEKGIQVVGEARSGLEAIGAAAKLKPNILLFHVNLFKGKKIDLLRALREKSPRTKAILLTVRPSDEKILEALSYGAQGYLKENAINTFLPKAVRMVNTGEAWLPRRMVAKIIDMTVFRLGRERGRNIGN